MCTMRLGSDWSERRPGPGDIVASEDGMSLGSYHEEEGLILSLWGVMIWLDSRSAAGVELPGLKVTDSK
jgi:hypothetical protein